MNKFLALLLFTAVSFGQKITVADLQLRINPAASEELFYSFAAGDRVLLTVEEANGNTIDEVSVFEYPETYKYKSHEIKKEKNREFIIGNKAVYKFRFSNTAKDVRLCTVKIIRIPASKQTENYVTSVKWITKQDTVWNSVTKDVVVGYDTLKVQKTRKVPYFEKKYEEIVMDKNQRVEARTTIGETRVTVPFSLPVNVIGKDETKKVVAWAYWVGVGKESNEYWNQNRKMIVGAVQGAASYFTTPLGGIAAGALTNLALPNNGEDVAYTLVNESNSKLLFQDKVFKSFDEGKGIAGYKRFTDANMLQGKYLLVLANDNYVQPIDVNVKVSAIVEHTKYKDEKFIDFSITPRYEKQIIKQPQVNSYKIPVSSDWRE
ncbi:MAG: hypothetical protein DI539_08610 [Flavobacterium psychrophilum]|nr:MAG: hypothetical protein DI539_08610 [Flavobacterium psychrophilum]